MKCHTVYLGDGQEVAAAAKFAILKPMRKSLLLLFALLASAAYAPTAQAAIAPFMYTVSACSDDSPNGSAWFHGSSGNTSKIQDRKSCPGNTSPRTGISSWTQQCEEAPYPSGYNGSKPFKSAGPTAGRNPKSVGSNWYMFRNTSGNNPYRWCVSPASENNTANTSRSLDTISFPEYTHLVESDIGMSFSANAAVGPEVNVNGSQRTQTDFFSYAKALSQQSPDIVASSYAPVGCAFSSSPQATPLGTTGGNATTDRTSCGESKNFSFGGFTWDAADWLGYRDYYSKSSSPDPTYDASGQGVSEDYDISRPHPDREIHNIELVLACQARTENGNGNTINTNDTSNTTKNPDGTSPLAYGSGYSTRNHCLEHTNLEGYPTRGDTANGYDPLAGSNRNFSARYRANKAKFSLEDYYSPYVQTEGFDYNDLASDPSQFDPALLEVGSIGQLQPDGSYRPYTGMKALFSCQRPDAVVLPCWMRGKQGVKFTAEDNTGISNMTMFYYKTTPEEKEGVPQPSPTSKVFDEDQSCPSRISGTTYSSAGGKRPDRSQIPLCPLKTTKTQVINLDDPAYDESSDASDTRRFDFVATDASGRTNYDYGRGAPGDSSDYGSDFIGGVFDDNEGVQEVPFFETEIYPASYRSPDGTRQDQARHPDGSVISDLKNDYSKGTRIAKDVAIDRTDPSSTGDCRVKTPSVKTQGPAFGPKAAVGDLFVKGTLNISGSACDVLSGILYQRLEYRFFNDQGPQTGPITDWAPVQTKNGGYAKGFSGTCTNSDPLERADGTDYREFGDCSFDTTQFLEGTRIQVRGMAQDLVANTGYSTPSDVYRVDNTKPTISIVKLRPDPPMKDAWKSASTGNPRQATPWYSENRWTNRRAVIAEWSASVDGSRSSPLQTPSSTTYIDGFATNPPCTQLDSNVNMTGDAGSEYSGFPSGGSEYSRRTGTQTLANRPTRDENDCGQGRHTFKVNKVEDLLNEDQSNTEFYNYDSVDPASPTNLRQQDSTGAPSNEQVPKQSGEDLFIQWTNAANFGGPRRSPLWVNKYTIGNEGAYGTIAQPGGASAVCLTISSDACLNGPYKIPANERPSKTGEYNLRLYHRDEAGNEAARNDDLTVLSVQAVCLFNP